MRTIEKKKGGYVLSTRSEVERPGNSFYGSKGTKVQVLVVRI